MTTKIYEKQSHTTWDCNYHGKFRKSKLFQVVRKEIWEIIQELSKRYDFEIVKWNIAIDHVHMLLKIAPKYSVLWIVWILKYNRHWKKKMLW